MTIPPDDPIASSASQPGAGRSSRNTGWRLIGWVIVGILALFVAGFVPAFFVGVVLGVTGLNVRLGPTNTVAISKFVATLGISIGLSWIALRNGARAGRGDARAGVGDHAIAHPMVVALISAAIVAYAAAITFGALNASRPALRNLLSTSPWIVCVNFVMITVAAPICEELFFRGWIWTELRARWSVLTTAGVTSAVWLALHVFQGIGHVTLLLPLAIALPLARHFGRSVRASIIVHACNNAASVAIPWISLWLGWLARP